MLTDYALETVRSCSNFNDPVLMRLHDIATTRDSDYMDRLIGDFNPLCEMCVTARKLWEEYVDEEQPFFGGPVKIFCPVCIKLSMRGCVSV